MRLLRRRTLWLRAALLLIVVFGVWLLAPRSRITQANFDRIQDGMSKADVCAMLGEPDPDACAWMVVYDHRLVYCCRWGDGPAWIQVMFEEDRVLHRRIYLATAWETVTWYA